MTRGVKLLKNLNLCVFLWECVQVISIKVLFSFSIDKLWWKGEYKTKTKKYIYIYSNMALRGIFSYYLDFNTIQWWFHSWLPICHCATFSCFINGWFYFLLVYSVTCFCFSFFRSFLNSISKQIWFIIPTRLYHYNDFREFKFAQRVTDLCDQLPRVYSNQLKCKWQLLD